MPDINQIAPTARSPLKIANANKKVKLVSSRS